MKFCRYAPAPVSIKDGIKKNLDGFSTGMHATVFLHGEYEKALTEMVSLLLREGDVCLDVGANFGWYSTVFHKYCGEGGEVHAFEPTPPSFERLARNYELMGKPENVFINNFALGEKEDELKINLFPDRSSGHASLSDHGRGDAIGFSCRVKTLDSYLREKQIADINFIKVDIEGAELMFLKGAETVFKQKTPPIFLMEMALEQTKNFGYLPDHLIEFIKERFAHDFFKVDEINKKLRKKNDRFDCDDIGANVFCFPARLYGERLDCLKDYFA